MKVDHQKLNLDQPATYQIKVPGRLDERWSDWVEGMTITIESGGNGSSIRKRTSNGKQEVEKHPNKHIRDAIYHAVRSGCTVTKSSGRAHIWGILWCPHRARDGCRIRVMSTPRNPENHAYDIRRDVDRCPH